MNLSSLSVVLLPIFQFFRKGNIFLPDDSAIALLGIYSEELKTYPHNLHIDVYDSYIHICQNFKATKMSLAGGGIYKLVHPDNGILFGAIRNELSSHDKTWRNHKYILVSRKGLS